MDISKNRFYSWRLWLSNYSFLADICIQETFPIFLKFRSQYKWYMQIIKNKKTNTSVVYNFLLRSLPNPLPPKQNDRKEKRFWPEKKQTYKCLFSRLSTHLAFMYKARLILLSLIIDPFFIYISWYFWARSLM